MTSRLSLLITYSLDNIVTGPTWVKSEIQISQAERDGSKSKLYERRSGIDGDVNTFQLSQLEENGETT